MFHETQAFTTRALGISESGNLYRSWVSCIKYVNTTCRAVETITRQTAVREHVGAREVSASYVL
jgi:hypothetical protein